VARGVSRPALVLARASGGEDRLHQGGRDVIDVPGHGDAWGNSVCGAEPLDVALDRGREVEDACSRSADSSAPIRSAYRRRNVSSASAPVPHWL
jgi:hypothetical protein